MKKTLAVLLILAINLFAGDQNIGFQMNQKYVCISQGAMINDKIVPILSREDALKHPVRIVVDDNNVLNTDGTIKNLKHIEKTVYGNSDNKIILMVNNNKRYIVMLSKQMKNIPIFYICTETDKWTLAK
jgi:predicted transport protein